MAAGFHDLRVWRVESRRASASESGISVAGGTVTTQALRFRSDSATTASCGRVFTSRFHPTTTMPLSVGTTAPDFTLKSKTAEGLVDVTLSANFGQKPTVLLFFPLAFTGVCTQELCDLTGGLDAYSTLGADVIAVSVDSPFAQEAWAQKEGIKIKLVSDLNKTVTAAYDVVFPALAGIGDTAARSAFVIDKDGVIRYAEQTPTPKDLPDFDAVKAVLAGL
jgi:peroxiredoxin